MEKLRVGFAVCGSFCTLRKAIEQMEILSKEVDITPIASPIVQTSDTRFGRADEFMGDMERIAGKPPIKTVVEAEPVGPRGLFDVMVIAPCTGNTLSKLTNGITDTSVTMAAKAHLRNGRPLVLAVATNDALGATGKNIGALFNTKNIYFVPMAQDDPSGKPTSLIADFSRLRDAVFAAAQGKQLQPLLYS